MAVKRKAITQHLDELLRDDGILLIPTAPGPAPPLAMPAEQLNAWRKCVMTLTCIAGLAGLPQVSTGSKCSTQWRG